MLRQGSSALRSLARSQVIQRATASRASLIRELHQNPSASQSSHARDDGRDEPIDITESHTRQVALDPRPFIPRLSGSMEKRRARQAQYDNGRGPKDAERIERNERESNEFFIHDVDPSQARRKGLRAGDVGLGLQDLEMPVLGGPSRGKQGQRKTGGGSQAQGSRDGQQRGPRGLQAQGGDRRGRGGKPVQKARVRQRTTAVARRGKFDQEERVPRVTAERLPEKRDQSPRAMFGARSLVKPPRRGARDPEKSFWAKGMEPQEARTSEILRLAGAYSLILPSSPHPAELPEKTSPAEKAKAIATWTIAQNPTVGMRKTAPGSEVLSAFLK